MLSEGRAKNAGFLPIGRRYVELAPSSRVFAKLRFDWRLNAEGEPKLLEVNPNPGWCWDGHLAKMAQLINLSYTDMLALILRAVEDRLGI